MTGGAGFLGRYIVKALLERGDEVTVFQRSAANDLAESGVIVCQGNLTHADEVARAIEGKDAVIHVAAKAGVWGKREEYEAINIGGTANVLAACRKHGVRWMVHTSTPSVVFSGESFQGEDESLPYGRNWLCHYAETKATAEQMVLQANGPRFETCALRPHLIWGVGDPHLLPRVLDRARAGRLAQIGTGKNRADITHVRNAADAHVQALDALQRGVAGGKAYFLSQGEPVVLWDWVAEILHAVGIPPLKRRLSLGVAYCLGATAEFIWKLLRLDGEPPMTRFVATELAKDHWFSIEAARADLGYEPEKHPTSVGLSEYLADLKAKT